MDTLKAMRSRNDAFGEGAFSRLHSDTMDGFYRYCEEHQRFRDDETNHRVHQRLRYVLLSCPDGAAPKGKTFRSLAEEAFRLIQPTSNDKRISAD